MKKGLILGQIRVADAEEELKRNMADWTKDKADETRWNIKSLQKGIDKLAEEINGMKLDNELKERTIDNKVKESSLALQNLMAEILLKGSQKKVNEEQAKAIPAQILQGWEELTKKEKADETRWNIKSLQKGIDKLAEEINGMKLDNDLKERTIDNKVRESSLILQNLMAEIYSKEAREKSMKSKKKQFQHKKLPLTT